MFFENYNEYPPTKTQFIPTCIYRIGCLLLAEEVRQNVLSKTFPNFIGEKKTWPLLDLCGNDTVKRQILHLPDVPRLPCEDMTTNGSDIISFCREVDSERHPGPDPGLILQALTLTKAKDSINQERLEIIGDAFLEYVIILKLCVQLEDNEVHQMEGKKQNLVKNFTLYQLAITKKLSSYLIARPFVESAWVPPCYLSQRHQKIRLCDKCIADTVQALIGAFLLACGQRGALRYMEWIGLDPLPSEEKDFKRWPNYPFISSKTTDLGLIKENFHHDYEKLCRLGNAIISYLVTRILIKDDRQLSPDEISCFRAEITSKKLLSLMAMKLRLHDKIYDLERHQEIKKEINEVEKSSFFEFFEVRF